jgi:hypothetical protein
VVRQPKGIATEVIRIRHYRPVRGRRPGVMQPGIISDRPLTYDRVQRVIETDVGLIYED